MRRTMGSAPEAPAAISSNEEEKGAKMPAAGKRKTPEDVLSWAEGVLAQEDREDAVGNGLVYQATMQEFLESLMNAKGIVVGDKEGVSGDKNTVPDARVDDNDDDDDCIILDGDPDKPVAVAKEEGGPRRGAAEDELQIVAQKGEIACRDFPHPRHLCATLPFSTSSHASHCSMCHCYVCDCPAPCAFWGKGTARTDHCHATEKEAKWMRLRHTSKNKSQTDPKQRDSQHSNSITTAPSSQHPANVFGFTGRFPVSSTVSQNQQVCTSLMVSQNMRHGICLPSASYRLPRTTIPNYGSKSARVGTPFYTPSNGNRWQPSVPNCDLVQTERRHAPQTAQIPQGSHASAETFQRYPQFRVGLPIGSQGQQYRPSYPQEPQLAPNTVVGTGVPISRCASLDVQGTQCPQVPSADTILKEALANLARQLEVPDYNTDQPLGRQSTSTPQYPHKHPSEILLAQGAQKASQQCYVKKSNAAATSQIGSSSGHNSSNHASGATVPSSGSIQFLLPPCQLKSQSGVTPSGSAPNTSNLRQP